MNPLKGACIIGQSGGPTAVNNASALGAIQSALQSEQVTRACWEPPTGLRECSKNACSIWLGKTPEN